MLSPHLRLLCFVQLWIGSHCQLNQYIQYISSNGDYVWKSISDFVPVQSQSFGTITIGHIMSMEFDFVWNGRNASKFDDVEYEMDGGMMFFRVGADSNGGNGCYGNQNRYPALFVSGDDSPYLSLYLSEEDACSMHYDLRTIGAITEGVWYHVLIAFNQSSLTVLVDNESMTFSRAPTANDFIGSVVPVWWMSNKYGSTEYLKADGTFSNITIVSTVLPVDPTIPTTQSKSTPSPTSRPTLVAIDGTKHLLEASSSATTSDGQVVRIQSTSRINTMVIMTVLMFLFLCFIGIIITFYSLFQRQHSLKAQDRARALSRLRFEREHHDALKVEKSGDLEEISNINDHSKVSKVYKALAGFDYDAEDEESLDRLGVEYDNGSFEVIESVEITAGNEANRNHSSSLSELRWPLLQGMTILVDDYDDHDPFPVRLIRNIAPIAPTFAAMCILALHRAIEQSVQSVQCF